MAQNDMLKRYLDAGIAFTQMTRARAEEIITELVKAGEIQRDQVQSQVDELIERSRRNTDQLVAMVRQEVAAQFSQLPVATKDDLKALERWITQRLSGAVGRASSTRSAGKSAAAKRPAAGTTTPATAGKAAATKRSAPAKTTAAKTAKAAKSTTATTAKAGTAAKSTTAKAAKKTVKKASPSGTSSGA